LCNTARNSLTYLDAAVKAFAGTDNTEPWVQNGKIYVDVAGNGTADFNITPTGLTTVSQLVAADFQVRPLTKQGRWPRHLIQAAAATLGLSKRRTYLATEMLGR
jgi:hypothetical protein